MAYRGIITTRYRGGENSGAALAFFRRLGDAVERVLDCERGRWFLWLPVLFGCGIGLYLAAPSEPPLSLAIAGVLAAIPLRIFLRHSSFSLIFSSALLMVALGFCDAKLRSMAVDGPILHKTMRYAQLDGWVETVERQEKRTRVTLRLIALEGIPPDKAPHRVRVSLRGKTPPPTVGTAIRIRATLMPPPEPAMPGGFDFGRLYWFLGLGASGYAIGKPEVLSGARPPWDLRVKAAIDALRQAIAGRVTAVLSGDSGAIAQALIVGERGKVSEEAATALRNSGLIHVISISGLHMALTAGGAFWAIRALLALFPGLALRFRVKAWAAVAAMVVATGYLVISGAAVSAVRSYIMVAVMFGAIVLNRPVLSLRNVAFSALIILVLWPESLLHAGFQMSFAATAALIAFYEMRPPLQAPAFLPRVVALPVMLVFEAAMTALLASTAVDPIGAFQFHRIAVYSVLGNVLASPFITLIVMPMSMLSLMAMPFGLEAWPLTLMERGIVLTMRVANGVSALPGAVVGVPAFSLAAFLLMIGGGLWLCIWTGRMRYWGLAAIAAGLIAAPFHKQPDIWVDRDGKLVAVRDQMGQVAVRKTRKATFSLSVWMETDGDTRPVKQARGHAGFQCDGKSCVVLVKGKLVSHVLHPAALAEDCRRAAVLITALPLPERCPQPEVVIDGRDLREKGAHTLRLPEGEDRKDDEIVVNFTAAHRGVRPWSVKRVQREKISP
ncbi:MAG: ComEC/Rec2 family competence protein [Alphaproteobacteria bacterium]